MSLLENVSRHERKPLPVIVMADVSGSMAANGKIQALNGAMREMLASFSQEENTRAEIHVSVVTFGGSCASLHCPLQPARSIKWTDMVAMGMTPMGSAMTMVREMLEDRTCIPSKAYRPTLILVSDGYPNDAWQEPMRLLTTEGRSQKADRMALAIGEDADENMLRRFLVEPERPLFHADDAADIHSFFRFATMSMTMRSQHANPNAVPSPNAVSKHYSLPKLKSPFSESF